MAVSAVVAVAAGLSGAAHFAVSRVAFDRAGIIGVVAVTTAAAPVALADMMPRCLLAAAAASATAKVAWVVAGMVGA